MPHRFPLHTRRTQTRLGLIGVSHAELQQTDIVVSLAVVATTCLRTEWLTNAQDYPDIIIHCLYKHSSSVPAEIPHSLFAVDWFTTWP